MGQRQKEDLNIPTMIFCIIGVVLTVFGVLLAKTENFKLKVFSTEGTVSSVQTKTRADGNIESRDVTLSYIANNTNYTANIYNYANEIVIGEKMTLYYDIISPENIAIKRSGYIGYLAIILGIILGIKTGPRFLRIIRDNYL